MIIKDSSGPYFEPAIPAIRLMFGEELLITRVENLQTVSMLGYNGFNDVSWPESRIVSNQTSVIQKSVPLLRGWFLRLSVRGRILVEKPLTLQHNAVYSL